jgi:hypothetical protein
MGCDIHAWVEKKVEGEWVAVEELNQPMSYMSNRCYNWFGYLAGIRSAYYGKCSGAQEVTPDKLSATCRVLFDHDFNHTLNVISYRELLEARERYLKKIEEYEDPEDIAWEKEEVLGAWMPVYDEAKNQQYYRVAFWFDS